MSNVNRRWFMPSPIRLFSMLVLLSVVMSVCLNQNAHAGYTVDTSHVWNARNIIICWDSNDLIEDYEKDIVEDVIDATWGRLMYDFTFDWRPNCNNITGLVVKISHATGPHVTGIGTYGIDNGVYDLHLNFDDSSRFLQGLHALQPLRQNCSGSHTLTNDNTGSRCCNLLADQQLAHKVCLQVTAVHEFGHLFGLGHEHHRDDAIDHAINPNPNSNPESVYVGRGVPSGTGCGHQSGTGALNDRDNPGWGVLDSPGGILQDRGTSYDSQSIMNECSPSYYGTGVGGTTIPTIDTIPNLGLSYFSDNDQLTIQALYNIVPLGPVDEFVYHSDGFERNGTVQTDKTFAATAIVREKSGWQVGAGKSGYGYAITNQAYGYVTSDRITVEAGKPYEVEVAVRGEVAADATRGTATARIFYYDANNVRLSWKPIMSENVQSMDWKAYKLKTTPPAGTKYAQVQVMGYQFSGWVAFDNVKLFKLNSSGNRTGSNLVKNPGFESNANWTVGKSSKFPATAVVRENRGWQIGAGQNGYGYAITNQAYGSITSDYITAEAGKPYEVEVSLRGRIASDATRGTATARIFYYDANKKYLSWEPIMSENVQSLTWKAYKLKTTPPSGAKYTRIQLIGYQFSGWVAFDDIKLFKLNSSGNRTGSNLVKNPGFESNANWQASPSSRYPATSIVRDNATSPAYSVATGKNRSFGYVITNQAYGTIQSTIDTRVTDDSFAPISYEDMTFEASLDVRGEVANDASHNNSMMVRVRTDASAPQVVGGLTPEFLGMSWDNLKVTFDIPWNATEVTVEVLGHQFSGWVAIDNLVIERIR